MSCGKLFSFYKKQCISSAKFDHLLRSPKNGLLSVLRYASATIFRTPCMWPNFLVRKAG